MTTSKIVAVSLVMLSLIVMAAVVFTDQRMPTAGKVLLTLASIGSSFLAGKNYDYRFPDEEEEDDEVFVHPV